MCKQLLTGERPKCSLSKFFDDSVNLMEAVQFATKGCDASSYLVAPSSWPWTPTLYFSCTVARHILLQWQISL